MTPIELKVILVEDPKIGGYTAYLEKFPNVIAEGDTEEEAMKHLKGAFFGMVADRINSSPECGADVLPANAHYDTKTITICA